MKTNTKNLDQYLTEYEEKHKQNGIKSAINDIASACIKISELVNQGLLVDIHGASGNTNVQGEDQQQLDVLSNQIIIDVLSKSDNWAGLASEEMTDILPIEPKETLNNKDKYLCLFDPLDGSGNIDINMPIGTIFSVLPYNKSDKSQQPINSDFLQQGIKQVAAGYVLYGTSTEMVLTLGDGVISMTLDKNTNEFYITKASIKISEQTNLFNINMSNFHYWQQPIRTYIDECLEGNNGTRQKNYNMRWTGCMVADIHRVLYQGGVFMYPADNKDSKKPAKLRLMYEANPIGMLVEQAGGRAITGIENILTIQPEKLHQRVPVIMGSKAEIDYIEALHKK